MIVIVVAVVRAGSAVAFGVRAVVVGGQPRVRFGGVGLGTVGPTGS
jgi:hypothetical protein